MSKILSKAMLLGLASIGLAASGARADVIFEDPLHGFCDASAPACVDNGTNTPLGGSTSFGFSISPGPQTGDLFLVILLPDNYSAPASFSITGTQGGPSNNLAISATATLFSVTPWTTGDLDAYFGVSASPANPIGAYLPSTQLLDPAATGFFAYVAAIGQAKIWDNANETNGPIFDAISGLGADLGAYVIGFCGTGCNPTGQSDYVATANSGALLVDGGGGGGGNFIPEPTMLALLVMAFVGMGLARRNKIQ